MPPKTKYRIGNFESGIMLAIAFSLWGLMVILSFTGIGEIASEFIALVGSFLFAAWFWVRGAYKNKAALQNLMVTLGGTITDMIPFVNDMPIMIIEVACVLLATRREDVRMARENKAKAAHDNAQEQARAEAIQQQAQIAAANANAIRQQALEESKLAA